jgi:hypothetical protein
MQARRPLTLNRVRTVHATARSALDAAARRRKIAHNRVLYLGLKRVHNPRALIWTDERARRQARPDLHYNYRLLCVARQATQRRCC